MGDWLEARCACRCLHHNPPPASHPPNNLRWLFPPCRYVRELPRPVPHIFLPSGGRAEVLVRCARPGRYTLTAGAPRGWGAVRGLLAGWGWLLLRLVGWAGAAVHCAVAAVGRRLRRPPRSNASHVLLFLPSPAGRTPSPMGPGLNTNMHSLVQKVVVSLDVVYGKVTPTPRAPVISAAHFCPGCLLFCFFFPAAAPTHPPTHCCVPGVASPPLSPPVPAAPRRAPGALLAAAGAPCVPAPVLWLRRRPV